MKYKQSKVLELLYLVFQRLHRLDNTDITGINRPASLDSRLKNYGVTEKTNLRKLFNILQDIDGLP